MQTGFLIVAVMMADHVEGIAKIITLAEIMASKGLNLQTLRTTKTSPIKPHSPGSPNPAKKSPIANAVYFGIKP